MKSTAQTFETVAIPVAQPRPNERRLTVMTEPPSVYGPAFVCLGHRGPCRRSDFACLGCHYIDRHTLGRLNFCFPDSLRKMFATRAAVGRITNCRWFESRANCDGESYATLGRRRHTSRRNTQYTKHDMESSHVVCQNSLDNSKTCVQGPAVWSGWVK